MESNTKAMSTPPQTSQSRPPSQPVKAPWPMAPETTRVNGSPGQKGAGAGVGGAPSTGTPLKQASYPINGVPLPEQPLRVPPPAPYPIHGESPQLPPIRLPSQKPYTITPLSTPPPPIQLSEQESCALNGMDIEPPPQPTTIFPLTEVLPKELETVSGDDNLDQQSLNLSQFSTPEPEPQPGLAPVLSVFIPEPLLTENQGPEPFPIPDFRPAPNPKPKPLPNPKPKPQPAESSNQNSNDNVNPNPGNDAAEPEPASRIQLEPGIVQNPQPQRRTRPQSNPPNPPAVSWPMSGSRHHRMSEEDIRVRNQLKNWVQIIAWVQILVGFLGIFDVMGNVTTFPYSGTMVQLYNPLLYSVKIPRIESFWFLFSYFFVSAMGVLFGFVLLGGTYQDSNKHIIYWAMSSVFLSVFTWMALAKVGISLHLIILYVIIHVAVGLFCAFTVACLMIENAKNAPKISQPDRRSMRERSLYGTMARENQGHINNENFGSIHRRVPPQAQLQDSPAGPG